MRVVAIIQARMGSTRLPGKVLKDLAGDTVLARVVNRTRRAKLLDEVVVATTTEAADESIVAECERLKVAAFRGSETDVLDRYYQAAQKCSADAVVRITSDCPLMDPELVDHTVRAFEADGADYATNSLVVTYPRGLDVEVFTTDALRRAWKEAQKEYQRIHVTPYFYEGEGKFKIVSLAAPADFSNYRWTLDTSEDLQLLRTIYEHFGGRDDMSWREVLAFVESKPELAAINSNVRQKALHEG